MSIFDKPIGHFLDDSHSRLNKAEPAIKAMHIYLLILTDFLAEKGALNKKAFIEELSANINALKKDEEPAEDQDKIIQHLNAYLEHLEL